MRRICCLAWVCVLSSLVAACGVVRQGLPGEFDAGRPRVDASGDAQRPVDAAVVVVRDAPVGAPDYGLPAGPLGAACEGDRACGSGFCVDGVCCQSACQGTCEACDLPGMVGSCVPVTGTPRGPRAACLGAGTPCAGSCDGQVRASCRYPAGDTECAPGSCSAGVASARSVCSGTGVCLPPTMVSCAPFSCSGAICAGGCSASSPCTPGNFCQGGRCVPLGSAGAACSAAGECQSGFCANGRCCNRACTGACESCDRPGQAGSCGSIPFNSDANNCGGCGNRCSANHVAPICAAGTCAGACSGRFADCNNNKGSDGCEIDTASDPRNCGGCGAQCPGTRCLQGICEQIEFEFSFVGMVAGKTCLSVDEPGDPHFWVDNYLCTQRDFGLRWSIAGEIPGMTCTQIIEPSDPDFWSDNFLCAPVDYGLRWSFAGPIMGMRCTLVNEPSDPNFWTDNYLCAPP